MKEWEALVSAAFTSILDALGTDAEEHKTHAVIGALQVLATCFGAEEQLQAAVLEWPLDDLQRLPNSKN